MRIDGTEFGTITINGVVYDHDIVVRRSGEVTKRKKKLSKRIYGTSHIISEDEADYVFEEGCTKIVLGTGQYGSVALSPEAELFFRRRGCVVIAEPTPRAIETFNREAGEKVGLFHVTC
jgi:hypothetical protein